MTRVEQAILFEVTSHGYSCGFYADSADARSAAVAQANSKVVETPCVVVGDVYYPERSGIATDRIARRVSASADALCASALAKCPAAERAALGFPDSRPTVTVDYSRRRVVVDGTEYIVGEAYRIGVLYLGRGYDVCEADNLCRAGLIGHLREVIGGSLCGVVSRDTDSTLYDHRLEVLQAIAAVWDTDASR
jgi:hypothetical protein